MAREPRSSEEARANGRNGARGFGPPRDFPGARPTFGAGAVRGTNAPARGVAAGPHAADVPPPPAEIRLTHGHRPEDGVPLRAVDIPRRPPAAVPPTPPALAPPAPHGPSPEALRIELLERRIAKLARLLEEQSAQLQLRAAHASADPGLASVHATVQGLKGDSEEVQRKRALMSSIFEANRKLRERVGSVAQEAE